MHAVEYVPHERTTEPVAPSAFADAVTNARALIGPLQDLPAFVGPQIEAGVASLTRILDGIAKTQRGAPDYIAGDALAATKRVRSEADQQLTQAKGEADAAKRDLRALAVVPIAADVLDMLTDQEIRGVVRAMTAKERAALLEDLRSGSNPRAALALARSPMPGELEREAGEIYARTSHPERRSSALTMVQLAEGRQDAAKRLGEAADATKQVVAVFIQAAAARREDEAAARGQKPLVSRGDPPVPPTATETPSRSTPAHERVTVQGQSTAITRVA